MAKKKVPQELTIPEKSYIETNLYMTPEQLSHVIGKPAELVSQYIKDKQLRVPSKSQKFGFVAKSGATVLTGQVSEVLDERRRMKGKKKPFVSEKLKDALHVIDESRGVE